MCIRERLRGALSERMKMGKKECKKEKNAHENEKIKKQIGRESKTVSLTCIKNKKKNSNTCVVN